ncbi:MAG: hypothetical protein AAGJ35_15510 [Myxococcota bacterium]
MLSPNFSVPQSIEQAVTLGTDLSVQVEAMHKKASLSNTIMESHEELRALTIQLQPFKDNTHRDRFVASARLKRALANFYQSMETRRHLYAVLLQPSVEQQQYLDALIHVIEVAYPKGTSFLGGNWREMYGNTKMMLKRLRAPDVQVLIQHLGLEFDLEVVAIVHQEFGRVAGYAEALSANQAPSLFARWKEAFLQFLMTVLTQTRKTPQLQADLLEPYTRFVNTRQRAKERKKKKKAKHTNEDSSS